MYLVDTNIWLERLLEQERSEEVGQFLDETPSDRLFMTDFTFHSIAIILARLGRLDALLEFVRDGFIDGDISVIHLEPGATQEITLAMKQFNLDFDDAYQYVSASKYNLRLLSLDSDFDRTERGRVKLEDIFEQPQS